MKLHKRRTRATQILKRTHAHAAHTEKTNIDINTNTVTYTDSKPNLYEMQSISCENYTHYLTNVARASVLPSSISTRSCREALHSVESIAEREVLGERAEGCYSIHTTIFTNISGYIFQWFCGWLTEWVNEWMNDVNVLRFDWILTDSVSTKESTRVCN